MIFFKFALRTSKKTPWGAIYNNVPTIREIRKNFSSILLGILSDFPSPFLRERIDKFPFFNLKIILRKTEIMSVQEILDDYLGEKYGTKKYALNLTCRYFFAKSLCFAAGWFWKFNENFPIFIRCYVTFFFEPIISDYLFFKIKYLRKNCKILLFLRSRSLSMVQFCYTAIL